ncbi:unnamed protein product [Orchesella dallaii]|uniref:Ubiquitin carboxyl-terminal hydrolase CYLD n=1 Tax=Orchesella dallaii TaxID=48710 RepID=A0ABP1QLV6_9HEXA
MDKIEAYRYLMNREVSYMKDGTKKQGTLRDIKFSNIVQNELLALIDPKNTGGFRIAFWKRKLDKVPLRQVHLPPSVLHSMPQNHRTHSHYPSSAHTQPPPPDNPPHLQYYGLPKQQSQAQPNVSHSSPDSFPTRDHIMYQNIIYQKCSLSFPSVDQDVVWLLPDHLQPQDGNPYIGKVKFIGVHFRVTGEASHIAVVQFDSNTTNFPNNISKQFGYSSNVININDLLDLSIWLSSRESVTHAASRSERDQLTLRESDEAAHSYSALTQTQQETPSSSTSTPCNIDVFSNPDSKGDSKLNVNSTTVSDLIDLNDSFSMLSINDEKNEVHNNNGWKTSIDINHYIQEAERKDRLLGIQGKDNSCYMDACLFSLFSFNHALDELLSNQTNDAKENVGSTKDALRNIILPLRRDYFVDCWKINDLRQILANVVNPEYRKSFMDAEDFIISLFHILKVSKMFEYDNGASDYVHQTVLPSSWESSHKLHSMTVQSLILESFTGSGLKLKNPPKELFIVKLPVSNGELIPCNYVLPNLKIDLAEIISPNPMAIGESPKVSMSLSAVICFRHSHFVAFVRTGKDELSPWIFMDSNPTTGRTDVCT